MPEQALSMSSRQCLTKNQGTLPKLELEYLVQGGGTPRSPV